MIADPRAARPGVAIRPIAKTGDLKCRMLVIDPEPATDDDSDEGLLRRFSPRFVNLPGITDDAAKPYPDGANDYQPSAVEIFLDDITTVRQAPRGLLGLGEHRLHGRVVRPSRRRRRCWPCSMRR